MTQTFSDLLNDNPKKLKEVIQKYILEELDKDKEINYLTNLSVLIDEYSNKYKNIHENFDKELANFKK